MRSPIPSKKSRLTANGKVIVAAAVLFSALEGRVDSKQAGSLLREQVGLNWSLLTALQFLCGKEALAAIELIPVEWEGAGLTKKDLVFASLLAAHTVANSGSGGSMLCASHLAGTLKGKSIQQWVAENAGPTKLV